MFCIHIAYTNDDLGVPLTKTLYFLLDAGCNIKVLSLISGRTDSTQLPHSLHLYILLGCASNLLLKLNI